jgi:uroporphyrinogen III methyltransferase / synthase
MSSPSFSTRVLENRTILVACSIKKMVELASGLERMGGKVLPFPVIEAQAVEETHLLDKALDSLREYSWIIFTSAYGVSFFGKRWIELGMRLNSSPMPKICAIGPATAAALGEFGWEATLIPKQFVAEGVLEALERYHGGLQALAGHRVLLPRAKEAREVLPDALSAAGVRVDVVPCYQTVRAEINDDIVQQIREKNPDLIVFTSSSAIRNLMEILGQESGKKMLMESAIAVIGPVAGNTAESFGKSPDIVPGTNTVTALLQAISDYYSRPSSVGGVCNA